MTGPITDPVRLAATGEARLIRWAGGLAAGGGAVLTAIIYFPVLWLALMSVSASPLDGVPGGFTLDWYRGLAADRRWAQPLLVSIEIAAIVALMCMASAVLVGRVLPRWHRWRGPLLALILLPMVVPGIVLGIEEFVCFRTLMGIRAGLWSLVLTHFIWAYPFSLLGVLIVSLRFDQVLLEAAADLGASPWRRFWDIERPLLMPGIVTAGLFGFLLSITELPRSIFVHGPVVTLPLFVWAEGRARASHVSLIFALNSLIALVSIVVSVLAVTVLTPGQPQPAAEAAMTAGSPAGPAALDLSNLSLTYGTVVALDQISLAVPKGEFLTILGPSGSGKTSLLRVIGGFEQPTEADFLRLDGVDVVGLPPNHRNIATVFQNYALFPHLSVGQNVEYGLKLRGLPADQRRRRADAALAQVRLADKYQRRITQLSGGERQRVAFARALVIEPAILLLDEPMGALDEKLRGEMQVEVRALQRRLGATFIQVTHSQDEALTMSDRIIVMNRGRIEQSGDPRTIFERPATRFVAAFMGLRNILDGTVADSHDTMVTIAGGDGRNRHAVWSGTKPAVAGGAVFFAVPPHRLQLSDRPGPDRLPGRVSEAIFRGDRLEIRIETDLGPLVASCDATRAIPDGEAHVGWAAEHAVAGPADRTAS